MSARVDLDQLKAALREQAAELMVELFGQPTQKGARWWRWGRKGSLSYRFDRGVFYSFEEQRGGSLLDAIMHRQGCSFAEAVDYAHRFLGDDATRQRPNNKPAPQSIDHDAEAEHAANQAAELWRAGRRIKGTAAERYLQSRAITRWPDAVRFIAARDVSRIVSSVSDNGRRKYWRWWRWPALVLPLTDKSGAMRAVQLIALTDQGEAVPHWDHGGKIKMVRGPRAGCALRLPSDADDPLILAEGGETALSIWLATGFEAFAALGSITGIDLTGIDKGRTIVVARDDDPSRSPARKALREAVARWRREGRRVVEAMPWRLSRGDKSDFNDVLQAEGLDTVRERIDTALRPADLPRGRPRVAAQLELATAVGRTMADLQAHLQGDGPAPFKVIRASLGLGKSEAALQTIIDAAGQGHRIVYSVPTHALATELAARVDKMASQRDRHVTVRVWHGREANNPDMPGQAMCVDLAPVELAQEAGVDVLETVCSNCPHKASCAYLAQRDQSAGLWLVPHALLFSTRPAAMAGASVLVIDEGFALAGMIGLQGRPTLVPLASMDEAVTAGSGKADQSADLNARLLPIRRQLLAAIADHPASEHGEPLQSAPLVDAGLTAELADDAQAAAGHRVRRVDAIMAATRPQLMRQLRTIVKVNGEARREAMLWGHVAALLRNDGAEASGRVELVAADDCQRAFRLYGLSRIGEGWRDMPTLHLDATADLDLLQLRVPHAVLVASIEAAEPHVAVHQVVGRTFGKMAMVHSNAADDVRRFAVAMAAERGGGWLLVGSKDAADAWRSNVPDYVAVAHWGAVRGLDTYGDVAGIVCAGRWGVPPNAVGRMAAILTGHAVARVEGGFPIEAVTITATDGTSRTVDAERHPDPTAEKVRQAIVEAELLQAIGRGRGVRRTAADPLTVYVLGNVPLPLPLASLSDWQPVSFDRASLSDHGAVLSSPADASILLGMSTGAVIKARQRQGQMWTCPNKESLYGHVHIWSGGLAAAKYQRAGERWAEQRMVFDPRRIPNPAVWLQARIGPLAHFELVDQPDRPDDGDVLPAGLRTGEKQAAAAALEAVTSTLAGAITFTDPTRLDAPLLLVDQAEANKVDPLADYSGGIMPRPVFELVRASWRASPWSQQQFADRVGISRPQLANALQGRFGLSAEAAARLRAVVASLPTSPQGQLL